MSGLDYAACGLTARLDSALADWLATLSLCVLLGAITARVVG
jgi:hypothetical protein